MVMNPDPVQCDRKCYDRCNNYSESASYLCTTAKYPMLTPQRQSGIDVSPPAAMNTGVTDGDQKCNRASKLYDAEVKLELRTGAEAHGSRRTSQEIRDLCLHEWPRARRSVAEQAKKLDMFGKRF